MTKRKFENPAAGYLAADAADHVKHGGCSAFGCPLAGSLSQSKDGKGHWYCFIHFGMKAEANDAVTARINANVWIAQLWTRVRQIDHSDWQKNIPLAAAYCEKKGRADLAPSDGESSAAYVSRLRNAMSAIAKPRNEKAEAQQLDLEAA